MKIINIIVVVLFLSFNVSAQIMGNGKLKTNSRTLENLKSIDIQFNANITLDYSIEEKMTITAEENIIDLVGIKFEDGKLTLDQIEWIESSRLPTITIGTPFLSSIYQGTHSTTKVKNVKGSNLRLEGNVGKLHAQGEVGRLEVVSTGTNMDLSELRIEKAFVSIDDDSKIILDDVKELETDLYKDARLVLLSDIEGYSKNRNKKESDSNTKNPDLRWIDFSIKNNSWLRNHFVVDGPKKDGSRFSYGFSMLPSMKKKERWSIGTKIYRERRSGSRELLITITADNEGEVVDLFQ